MNGINSDYDIQSPPTDSVSKLSFSPTSNLLAASSWDNHVRIWDLNTNGQSMGRFAFPHPSPVLTCCWSNDGSKLFTGACDNKARYFDLQSSKEIIVGGHDQPIKTAHWYTPFNMLVTGSWDKTIKFWDFKSQNPCLNINLPDKLYASSMRDHIFVAATANHRITIYDIRNQGKPFKEENSPLKMQSTCVELFTDCKGYALGSVEGRVAIQYFEEVYPKNNFAFKCHRMANKVFSVNSLSFNKFGTFSTAGGDGSYTFWDKDTKKKIKSYERAQSSITSTDFSADNSLFAYSVCYDWSKGIKKREE
eukprot:TRINITY_DN3794_c0_g1_i1.p1 TRINITY_DN3794_c0_g1~~TRINITY_DN3794_c0_g1_i1.p1  ORF type:complete len:306 (-),score=71.74 TRINITY_DN3794_c0_g1_i1:307-1224(-)